MCSFYSQNKTKDALIMHIMLKQGLNARASGGYLSNILTCCLRGRMIFHMKHDQSNKCNFHLNKQRNFISRTLNSFSSYFTKKIPYFSTYLNPRPTPPIRFYEWKTYYNYYNFPCIEFLLMGGLP